MQIVLTFDDGPHVADNSNNLTQKVAETLAMRGCAAAFFVQAGVSYRGGSERGLEIIANLYRAGHVIGIHTGMKGDQEADHKSYPSRVGADGWDATGNGVVDADDGANALESDMIYAKRRIQNATGAVPRYVRAVGGGLGSQTTRERIAAVLGRQGLTHVCWNVLSTDNDSPRPSADAVKRALRAKVAQRANKSALIVLFHDINNTTAQNLDDYIGVIMSAAGSTASLTETRREIEAIFDNPRDWDVGQCGALLISTPNTTSPVTAGSYYVQIVSLSDSAGANDIAARATMDGYSCSVVHEGGRYKVLVGPYPSRPAAERARDELTRSYPGAWVREYVDP